MSVRIFLALIVVLGGSSVLRSQDKSTETEANVGEWPPFVLSSEAKAAGIDGKLQIGLTVSAEGKASNIRIFGGPMWPCGVKQPGEVDDVRKAVKDYLLKAKFHPATKNGKPRSSDVQITFILSDLFRNAGNTRQIEDDQKKGILPPLVEVKEIQRFAISVTKQLGRIGNSPSYRLAEVQILVDEDGKVVSAGGFRTDPMYLNEARSLACSSTFKPLMFRQTPLRMTGILRFGLY